jgi:hypothetical protein
MVRAKKDVFVSECVRIIDRKQLNEEIGDNNDNETRVNLIAICEPFAFIMVYLLYWRMRTSRYATEWQDNHHHGLVAKFDVLNFLNGYV